MQIGSPNKELVYYTSAAGHGAETTRRQRDTIIPPIPDHTENGRCDKKIRKIDL